MRSPLGGRYATSMKSKQYIRLMGVLLVLLSVSPTIMGMVFAFRSEAVDRTELLSSWIGMSFSPLFVAFGSLGIVMVIISIIIRSRVDAATN